MIFIFDTLLTKKKYIEIQLLQCFGFGSISSIKLMARLGFNFGRKENLSQRLILDNLEILLPIICRRKILKKKVGYKLRHSVFLKLRLIKKMNSFRSVRHRLFLPVRKQRTRKNAGTQKSKRKYKLRVLSVKKKRK